MPIFQYNNIYPKISETAFVAPTASIIGDVTIGSGSSVWFNNVIRGDVAKIVVGNRTNIQDGTVVHVTRNGGNTIIGDNVTIGHSCLLHACNISSNSFIGMGSIIIDGAIIEEFSWVAAGSLVTNNKIIKSYEIWAGRPAKFFRKLTDEEINYISISAENYHKHSVEYRSL